MESYLMHEPLPLLGHSLPINLQRLGITGHSMGGQGALTLALKHPGRFTSLSTLAPIYVPSLCPWGQKAFGNYLGSNQSAWAKHDANVLMNSLSVAPYPEGILIDQGLGDKFLAE